MNKKIYIIQPTYRKMNGKKVKGWSVFNHSLFLPVFSAVIPKDWNKETCLEYLTDINYESDASVILISCMGYDIVSAMEIAQRFKEKNKKVIFGGHWDDFSEKIMSRVCDSVFYGYPHYKDMAKILEDVINNNLQSIYHFDININFPFDYSVLKGMNIPIMQVQAGIGCKNKCAYCCAAQVYQNRYRLRKIQFVLSDLINVRKMTRYVSFMDQNIYNNPDYMKLLCRSIIDLNLGLRWGAQATVDIGDNDELLNILYSSGCRVLFLGLESINKINLSQLNKNFNPDDYQRQVKNIRKHGIRVVGYFILGLDNDKEESFEELYHFVKKLHLVIPIINVLIPVPGTKIFDDLKYQSRLYINNETDFCEENPLYSVPTNRVFFKPEKISEEKLMKCIADLGKRLFTIKNILYRSFNGNLFIGFMIFIMNMELRKKYYVM
jgi:hypothetical protein